MNDVLTALAEQQNACDRLIAIIKDQQATMDLFTERSCILQEQLDEAIEKCRAGLRTRENALPLSMSTSGSTPSTPQNPEEGLSVSPTTGQIAVRLSPY